MGSLKKGINKEEVICLKKTDNNSRPFRSAIMELLTLDDDAILTSLNSMLEETKLRLFELNRKRNSMEEEMNMLLMDLRSPRGENGAIVGLRGEGRLIDDQGFPRADIDLYDVRTKRHRFACLQTDHKITMSQLETELKALHRVQNELEKRTKSTTSNETAQESEQKDDVSDSPASSARSDEPAPVVARTPFAKVDSVGVDSPADEAGLKMGDRILSFGAEERTLANLAKLVHENQTVEVVVERGGKVVQLALTPHVWSGRGLLGCYLVKC